MGTYPRVTARGTSDPSTFTRPRGLPAPDPAPAPRRFAQGMAATFMLGIGLSLRGGQPLLSGILELLLVAALIALVLGRFCLGSYLYHLVTGKRAFANSTLPGNARSDRERPNR